MSISGRRRILCSTVRCSRPLRMDATHGRRGKGTRQGADLPRRSTPRRLHRLRRTDERAASTARRAVRDRSNRSTPRKSVLLHYLLDPTFRQLDDACEVDGFHRYEARRASLDAALNAVIRLARSRDRLIVSWSHHELWMIIANGLDGMLAKEFATDYRDGKATGKRWLRATRPDIELRPGRSGRVHSLENYMELVGYTCPAEFGSGRTGENLKVVRGSARPSRRLGRSHCSATGPVVRDHRTQHARLPRSSRCRDACRHRSRGLMAFLFGP